MERTLVSDTIGEYLPQPPYSVLNPHTYELQNQKKIPAPNHSWNFYQ